MPQEVVKSWGRPTLPNRHPATAVPFWGRNKQPFPFLSHIDISASLYGSVLDSMCTCLQ